MKHGAKTRTASKSELEIHLENVCKGQYDGFQNYLIRNGIKNLDLSNKKNLSNLNSKEKLTPLNISHILRALGDTPGAPVTVLNLSNNYIGKEGAKIIKNALLNNTQLTSIDFSYTGLGYKGVKELEHALPRETVTINFAGNKIEDKGAAVISRMMGERSSVTGLILFDNDISPIGAKSIARELQNKTISMNIIDLSKNKIKDEGAKAIILALSTSGMTDLETLNLASNGITEKGISRLERIRIKFKHLNLSRNFIEDTGAKFISRVGEAWEDNSLISIDLSQNQIKDEGTLLLCKKFVGTVTELNLNGNLINDKGAITSLKILLQKHNSVTTKLILKSFDLTKKGNEFIRSISNLFAKMKLKNITFIEDKKDIDQYPQQSTYPRKRLKGTGTSIKKNLFGSNASSPTWIKMIDELSQNTTASSSQNVEETALALPLPTLILNGPSANNSSAANQGNDVPAVVNETDEIEKIIAKFNNSKM